MQIWASPFKTARCDAHKWTAVGEWSSGSLFGRLSGRGPAVWALWERLGRCGETDFYNEKEKGFTSPDLFLLPPPSCPNHSIAPCTRTSNQIRATWVQTHLDVGAMQIKALNVYFLGNIWVTRRQMLKCFYVCWTDTYPKRKVSNMRWCCLLLSRK